MPPMPESPVNFLSLFSGIGGLDLGLERAGMRCVVQVEIDPFCRKVLKKHWPGVPKFKDVRNVKADTLAGLRKIDLIAGGFPCQDISVAGAGIGIEGARSGLWKEFFRVICEVRPRFVLVENVAMLAVRGLSTVLRDLAEAGYDSQWDLFTAAEFGLPHLRERIFIFAHPAGERWKVLHDPASRKDAERCVSDLFKPGHRWECEPEGHRLERVGWSVIPEVRGSDDGVSVGLDERKKRLHALGNAVVPQVAEWIGRRILESLDE